MEELDIKREEANGIKDIWELIEPVWKYSKEELVELMSHRVVFQNDNLLALDKPYQMAYASAPQDQAQLDRVLQDLKKAVAPEVERLYLVTPLDKSCSGIVLFAKSKEKQEQLQKSIKTGHALLRFRCIARGIAELNKARISIPMIKVMDGRDYKLCPLKGTAKKRETLYHLNTDYRVVNENRNASISLLDCFVQRAMPHLVRSHLYYGINCPVLGDPKYIKRTTDDKTAYEPVRLSDVCLSSLGLKKNWGKRLPMYMHLAEMQVPDGPHGRSTMIRAELPAFFKFTLRRLSLLHK